MKNKYLIISIAIVLLPAVAYSQWYGQSDSSDLNSFIYRNGMIGLQGYNAAQIRLNSEGTYYGKIGNPYPQVWSLGWGGSWNDLTPVLSWTPQGRVGIGTIPSTFSLEVEGFGQSIRNSFASGYTTLRLYNDQNYHLRTLEIDYSGSSYPASLTTGGPIGESGSITTTGPYPLTLGTNNSARLVIASNGYIGIGTKNPDQALTVKGIIHTNEVRVDLNSPIEQGPDYVFESTYNLLPLSEVESYIKANKHLPEVPSAKQMEEEGLNLKEMNLLLLKKVEELTLHLIEQGKSNEVQNQKIADQQKEIEYLKSKLK